MSSILTLMRGIISGSSRNPVSIMLFLLMTCSFVSHGQEQISGIINRYGKVTSIGAGYVVIGNLTQAAQFSTGDYVMLIQMQGVGIQTLQGSYGVNVQAVFGTPGGYEFLVVQAVNYSTGRIDFTRNVYINSYNISSNVQLVQVPFYNSPVVTGVLSAQGWNPSAGTGGVLAMFAGRKLTLNADIDVSGGGFTGASGVSGIGECVYTNESANNHDSYPLSWNNAGLKGEGVAIHDASGVLLYPNNAKGQGRNFSGGGGGNGRYSGGGGGSNRGKGADGGREKFVIGECGNDPRDGGYGGMNIIGTVIQNGLFHGGGGGASTQASGATATAGGNGGGIIVIVTDTINGNGHTIWSKGNSASTASGDAGAGGGGAGGSVALSYQTITGQMQVSSDGGNGGSNPGDFGAGGGGGGGLIWLSSASTPPAISSATVASGTPEPSTPAEGIGEIKYDFTPSLNGFLFNSVISAATGTRYDTVCSNVMPGQMNGTTPVGGTPPYTYQWQSSITSATSGFAPSAGINNTRNYTPPSTLVQTTWFRRVVYDNGSITDISLPIKVTVHPYIKNNSIGYPDTLCYNQNASTLIPVATLQDGNGTYTYAWESSINGTVFTSLPATTASYLPAAPLTATTWYRRIVHSGACISVSASVRINVLDTIRNNSIITPAQEICYGSLFTDLQATTSPTLAGGDNTFRYRWESSSNGTVWTTATGTVTGAGYNPSESAPYFPGQQYFRRVVMSGSNNVCVNNSRPVLLNDYPVITNNSITSGDQTICSGSIPVQLTGSVPLNGKGAGTYTYTWQDSSKIHSWTNISGHVSGADQSYTPPALTDTTRFRRIVNSSACISTSKSVIVRVHKPVSNNIIALLAGGNDTTLCAGSSPHRLSGTIPTGGTNLPGDYAYQWSSSPDNSSWTDISTSGNSRNYQPGSLNATTYYRRKATSGQCSSYSSQLKINILPLITNNTISGNQLVCKGDIPELLSQDASVTLSGGSGSYSYSWEQSPDGLSWNPADGTNNSPDGTYQPGIMSRIMNYRRNILSGANNCCSSVSNIAELTLDSLPDGTEINAGADTILYSFDHIIRMTADPPFDGGTGKWTLVDGTGTIQNEADRNTEITGLSKGSNSFMWTVTRGACKLQDIIVVTVFDVVIPEGFSPNNDPFGYNNTFVIKGLDLPNQEAELTVVDGSGVEVFGTSNKDGSEWQEWDGKNMKGSDLPEGTYYYFLRIRSKGNSQVFKKSGFIILKRY